MEIKICPGCDGAGEIIVHDSIGSHETDYKKTRCERCKGTGRVYERNYTLEIPYADACSKEYLKADEFIVKIIRSTKDELQKH